MLHHERHVKILAVCLSALAGYVDAIGFLALGGLYVSFMSGNSTQLGVGFIEALQPPAISAALIAAFVLGVVAGSSAGRLGKAHQRAATLLLVAAVLAAAALVGRVADRHVAMVVAAVAMGAENAVFERESIGVTYMTGALVKVGQGIAGALAGGSWTAWLPYLYLWLALIAGAAGGAAAYPRFGLDALWFGAIAAAALAGAATLAGIDTEPGS